MQANPGMLSRMAHQWIQIQQTGPEPELQQCFIAITQHNHKTYSLHFGLKVSLHLSRLSQRQQQREDEVQQFCHRSHHLPSYPF